MKELGRMFKWICDDVSVIIFILFLFYSLDAAVNRQHVNILRSNSTSSTFNCKTYPGSVQASDVQTPLGVVESPIVE